MKKLLLIAAVAMFSATALESAQLQNQQNKCPCTKTKNADSFIKTEPCPKEFKGIAGDWKVKRDSDGNRVV